MICEGLGPLFACTVWPGVGVGVGRGGGLRYSEDFW